jgi:hypothetical protein
VYWQPVDRSAPEERLTPAQPKDIYYPNSVTPDGSRLAFYRNTNGGDIWTVPFGHDESPSPLISQPPHEDHGAYSPDGRWIAYRSDEPGQYEVFVQPIPPTGRRYQITTTGGMSPLWAPNGRELFYVTETEGGQARLAAVDVQTEPAFRFSQPAILPITVNGAGGGVRPYDVTPDGARFLVTVAVGGATDHPPELRIVLNWVSELRDRVR